MPGVGGERVVCRTDVKILAISDNELPQMQNVPYLRRMYGDVDLLVSCGDLSAAYIEFITFVLSVPVFYVRGNHDESYLDFPPGGDDLHKRVVFYRGLAFAGLEGSPRYNRGLIQFTDEEMLLHILEMAPGMLRRRLMRGSGVDVLLTHAPPRGIHDRHDRTHRGFRSLHLAIRLFRPRYLLHGHVDVYDRRETTATLVQQTQVINVNPVRLITVDLPPNK